MLGVWGGGFFFLWQQHFKKTFRGMIKVAMNITHLMWCTDIFKTSLQGWYLNYNC